MVQTATASPADNQPDSLANSADTANPRPPRRGDLAPAASQTGPAEDSHAGSEGPPPDDRAQRLIANQLRRLNLPAHFRSTTFETLDPAVDPEAYEVCQSYAETGSHLTRPGLLLIGPPGSGKTALAVAILRRTIERTLGRYSVAFWNVPRGLDRLRASFGRGPTGAASPSLPDFAYGGMPILGGGLDPAAGDPGHAPSLPFAPSISDTGPERLQDLLHHRLLVLDDLGNQRLTEWVAEQFYVLIDGLWSGRKQVVITTNLTPAALKSHLSPALVSRLLGLCHIVPLDGKDLRLCQP